jgi:hypothetical protein
MKQLELPKQKFANVDITPLITTWENEWIDEHWFPFSNERYTILLKFKLEFIHQLGFKNY